MMHVAPVLIHLLVALLAVSAGLMFGVSVRRPFAWAGTVAGVLTTLVAVGIAILSGTTALWGGPLLAVLAPVTTVLVSAEARREEPLFLVEPYWRRVILVLSARAGRPDAGAEARVT